ncbi:MAG: hypothetical protein ACFFB2_01450 [Promethearchaeota archaeon]
MRSIQLEDEIFEWQGKPEILYSPFYKITLFQPTKIIEVTTDTSTKGIVILGQIEAVVDAIVHTSQGAVGNTTTFTGSNLVIFGLSISELKNFLHQSTLSEQEAQNIKDQAKEMIAKLKYWIEESDPHMNISFDDKDHEYVIFGRKNFLLVAEEKKFVLIHKKQISVRKGEHHLVQVDPQDGISIVEGDKVLRIGGTSSNSLGSLFGELGVNIASSFLDHFLWD